MERKEGRKEARNDDKKRIDQGQKTNCLEIQSSKTEEIKLEQTLVYFRIIKTITVSSLFFSNFIA